MLAGSGSQTEPRPASVASTTCPNPRRSPGRAAGEAAPHTPVWFMRQAGRSLPEYRAVRGDGSILDAIKQPDLAAEITLQPVRRYGVDAAVLYCDIVVPVHAVGFGIDVAPGTGPVAAEPFRRRADLRRLRPLAAGRHRLRRRDRRRGRRRARHRRSRCWPSPAPRSPSPATSSRVARAAPTSTPRRCCTPTRPRGTS